MNEKYQKVYMEGKHELTLLQFTFLILVNEQRWDMIDKFRKDSPSDYDLTLSTLEVAGYVKQYGEQSSNVTFRTRGDQLFKGIKKDDSADVASWIDDWRKLFPEGTNSGGYRYRGDKTECLKKMIKFTASQPFSRDEIFEATRRYVDRFSVKNYQFMQQAHYFIEKKDSGSSLASECESLSEIKPKEEGVAYGSKLV